MNPTNRFNFSVVVPAFNAATTLGKTLVSVQSQTLKPLEVIVIDDCSTDGTRDATLAHLQAFESIGILLQYKCLEVNSGPSAARNVGIRAARGEYIAFLDSDDEWAPQKLQVIDIVAASMGPELICHSYAEPPAAREVTGSSKPTDYVSKILGVSRLLYGNPAQSSCTVLLRDTGLLFNERMRFCEDYDLCMRLVADGGRAIQLLGPPLTRLGRPQLSAGGLSGNRTKMRTGEIRVLYNFCKRRWVPRVILLPLLVAFSLSKHLYSTVRCLIH